MTTSPGTFVPTPQTEQERSAEASKNPSMRTMQLAGDAVAALATVVDARTIVLAARRDGVWRILAAVDHADILEHDTWRRALDAVLIAGPGAPIDAVADLRTVVVAPVPGEDTTVLAVLDREPVVITLGQRTVLRAFAEYVAGFDDRARELEAENARTVGLLQRRRRVVSEVVHDLRAPLSVIAGSAHLIKMHADEPDRVRSHARTISAHVERMATMIGGMLDAEARDLGHLVEEPVEVSLADLVTESVEQGRRLVSTDGVSVVGSGSGGSVRTYRIALQRLIANLVANAVKSTRNGTVSIDAQRDGVAALITVADTGAGMTSEQIARLIGGPDPAVDGASGGYGLGLSIVQRLASQLNGELRVDSQPDAGTRVTVCVPDLEDKGD